MTLQSRINALEQQAGGIGCPECGYYKGAHVEFEIITEPEECARHEDKSCSTCGRELSLTIDLGGAVEGSGDELTNPN